MVDATAAGGQRCVDLAEHAGALHDLPAFMGCVGSDDQRIQALRNDVVESVEFGRFLIGDGDLRQVAAVGASVTSAQVRISAVPGKTLAGQGTGVRLD